MDNHPLLTFSRLSSCLLTVVQRSLFLSLPRRRSLSSSSSLSQLFCHCHCHEIIFTVTLPYLCYHPQLEKNQEEVYFNFLKSWHNEIIKSVTRRHLKLGQCHPHQHHLNPHPFSNHPAGWECVQNSIAKSE